MQQQFKRMYQSGGDQTPSTASLLHLPIPSSSTPLDVTLQGVISSYLAHAFTAVIHTTATFNDTFVHLLAEPGCFASWIPHLTALPAKNIDSILKRNYVTLTTSVTNSTHLSPRLALQLRFFALRTLLLTSDLDCNSFWEQCLKFAMTYTKSASEVDDASDDAKVEALLQCFSDVVRCADQCTSDQSVKGGRSWVTFCEYWLSIARKVSNHILFFLSTNSPTE